MPSEEATSESEHTFQAGDEFKTSSTWVWEITNRMVDVDTEELLYLVQGLAPSADNHGKKKVVTEQTLTREGNGWRYQDTDTDRTGGECDA